MSNLLIYTYLLCLNLRPKILLVLPEKLCKILIQVKFKESLLDLPSLSLNQKGKALKKWSEKLKKYYWVISILLKQSHLLVLYFHNQISYELNY